MIDSLDLSTYRTRLGSAHVMGGCAMSEDAKLGVTNSLGIHHQLENLSIHDGSLFPTSIGANPQLSIYALCALLTEKLLQRLVG
jgi:choline dehydrogenase-like flavoprotein